MEDLKQSILFRFLLKYGKALITLLLDAVSQVFAHLLARAGEQVMTGDEEVAEFTVSQVVFEILQEHMKAATQI